jgi:hypothetical protein
MSRQSHLPEKKIENIIDKNKIKEDLNMLLVKAEKDDLWFVLNGRQVLTPVALREELEQDKYLYPFEEWMLRSPDSILSECKAKTDEAESMLAKSRVIYEQCIGQQKQIERAIEVVNNAQKKEVEDAVQTEKIIDQAS